MVVRESSLSVNMGGRLQVMLAVARGAWLLSPAWLTASLEAGRWQDEQDFQAEVILKPP
jgi:hypothetical protein